MNERERAWTRRQQERYLRLDAHRWIRPDVARYLKPGVDPADVYPALAMKRRKEEEAVRRVLAAEIEAERAEIDAMQTQIAMLRKMQAAIREQVARRAAARAQALKYSPSQPRDDHGRWTRGGGGTGSGSGGDGESGGDGGETLGFAEPMGNIDFGDLTGWSESDGLSNIASGSDNSDLVRIAGDELAPLTRIHPPLMRPTLRRNALWNFGKSNRQETSSKVSSREKRTR